MLGTRRRVGLRLVNEDSGDPTACPNNTQQNTFYQDHTHNLSGEPRLYESQHWPLSRSPPSKPSTAWKRPVQISTRSPSESSIVRLAGNACGGSVAPPSTLAPQPSRGSAAAALHRGSLGSSLGSSEARLTTHYSSRRLSAAHRPRLGGQGLLRPHGSERLLGAMARCGEPLGQRFLHAVRASVGARRRCAPVEGGGRSSRAVVRGLRARRRDCAERRCSRWGVQAEELARRRCRRGAEGCTGELPVWLPRVGARAARLRGGRVHGLELPLEGR